MNITTDNLVGIAVPDPKKLIALRQQAAAIRMFPRRQALSQYGSGYHSRFRGRGMEFDESRPYQSGDDVRSIDWRVTARTATTHTKIYREERERPVLIAIDLRSPMLFGSERLKSLAACDIATLLAWAGVAAGDRVGGLAFSSAKQWYSRPRKGHPSVLRLIHHLGNACRDLVATAAEVNVKADELASLLEHCRRVAVPGTTLVIISDFHDLDERCEKQLFELARHCDLTLCQVNDPLERALPPEGIYPVSNNRNTLHLDSRPNRVRARFSEQYQQRQAVLTALSTRLAIPLLVFSAEQPVLPVLRRAFNLRARSQRSPSPPPYRRRQ